MPDRLHSSKFIFSQLEKRFNINSLNASHPFLTDGTTLGDVYNIAAAIKSFLVRLGNPQRPICLATKEKRIVAAAMLNTLTGSPALVLPHALSDNAINEAAIATGFSHAIAEPSQKLPNNIRPLEPDGLESRSTEILKLSIVEPDRTILKIFTGGTTGRSQVWSKTVTNLWGEAIYLCRRFNINADDRILATVPPYHIYGLLFSVLIPLYSGAIVIPATPSYPEEIRSAIKKYRASILVSVPMHYRVLRSIRFMDVTKLRLAFSSAGPLQSADGDHFHSQSGIGVTEVYGSTESGGIATRNRGLGETYFTPFDVVDCNTSGDGHLYVRSPFISPDLLSDSSRWLKTGDRVKIKPGGRFNLMGRSDGVVKVGGKRVDLYHVQSKLKALRKVKDAFVLD